MRSSRCSYPPPPKFSLHGGSKSSAGALLFPSSSYSSQLFRWVRKQIINECRTLKNSLFFTAVGGIKITASVIMTQDYGHFSSFTPTVIVWLASSAAADLLITSGLTWSLRTRNFVGMKETEDKVTRIMRCMYSVPLIHHTVGSLSCSVTIQTGFITMAFAIIDLAVYVARPVSYLKAFHLPDRELTGRFSEHDPKFHLWLRTVQIVH